jgi:molybdopterin-guanine dinucleotide biosynthesis protein A
MIEMPSTTCGIFVGGRGTRMGNVAKGFLSIEGEPIVVRTARLARAVGFEVVLVGDATPYAALGIPALADDPAGIGPLGGLHALLGASSVPARDAIVVACDMPYVRAEDLAELARFAPDADVVAARRAPDAPWEALFSRWSARSRKVVEAAIAAGVRSFQRVLAGEAGPLDVRRIDIPLRTLRDWDEPADLQTDADDT